MGRRNINLVDRQADQLMHSKGDYVKATSEQRAQLSQPDRQTPGSQYSKNRKKKKIGTESNEKSSNSKAYEGGSGSPGSNEKVLLNQFEQQFLSNCHKTPQPNSMLNNNPSEMVP